MIFNTNNLVIHQKMITFALSIKTNELWKNLQKRKKT